MSRSTHDLPGRFDGSCPLGDEEWPCTEPLARHPAGACPRRETGTPAARREPGRARRTRSIERRCGAGSVPEIARWYQVRERARERLTLLACRKTYAGDVDALLDDDLDLPPTRTRRRALGDVL